SINSDANGNPLIGRPIFNLENGREVSVLTSTPPGAVIGATVVGAISVENTSELAGAEINFRSHWYVRERLHFDALAGLRYLRLAERMRIEDRLASPTRDFLTFLGNPVNLPNTLADEDSFRTVNQFFGPQIGARVSWEHEWFTLQGFAKLGIGFTEEQ